MTTWVLLRGMMRDTRHWGDFPLKFQKALNAQHVVSLDFLGNGTLHAHKSATSVAEMAIYCHTLLKQQGYTPPYSLLALSLGGMVAVAWSEMYPAELERMVLINTSMAPYNPFYHRLRPNNYPALFRFLLFGTAVQRESLILKLTSTLKNRSKDRQAILDRWTDYARQCPVSRANILRQLHAAAGYRVTSSGPSVPVLLLASQQDRLVDVKSSLTLAQRWQCPILLHPSAGHDLPLDDGDWVIQQVREWEG